MCGANVRVKVFEEKVFLTAAVDAEAALNIAPSTTTVRKREEII